MNPWFQPRNWLQTVGSWAVFPVSHVVARDLFPFAAEHQGDLQLLILLPQRWGTDIASYPDREATTPPLASLSGISTRRRPQPHSSSIPLILVCVGVRVVHVILVWPQERTWEVQRHRRMRIWGDTPIKGPPAITLCSFIRHQETCSRSPDAFAPHRVLTRLKVAEQLSWRLRPAGLSLGKSLSIGLLWRPSWRRQPYCWQSPCGFYRWWAARRDCSVLGLMHSSRRDPARPQNVLSDLGCVVRVTPPPFSSGLRTGNGGVNNNNNNYYYY